MKTAAIIAEYNPFHNGHAYQLENIKENLNCDYIIVIMSGEFTQRGIPAICSKQIRTQIALQYGADVIIELPLLFSTGSAEIFSNGSIRILNNLGCIDYLVYGTEQLENTDTFNQVLSILKEEPQEFKLTLKECMSNGLSYPAAIEKALLSYSNFTQDIKNIFLPNNLLALEYEKQLSALNSSIQGKTIQRIGNGYSDNSLESDYVSASALRKYIKNTSYIRGTLYKYMPNHAADLLENHFSNYCPIFEDDFSYILYSMLRNINKNYLDCNENFLNKVNKNMNNFYSFSQFASLLKSKDITYNKICRSLCHIMLDVTEDLWELSKTENNCLYARILGFNEKALFLLKSLKQNSSIPIISKTADAYKKLSANALRIFNQSINASNIYHDVCRMKSGRKTYNEYQYNVIKNIH